MTTCRHAVLSLLLFALACSGNDQPAPGPPRPTASTAPSGAASARRCAAPVPSARTEVAGAVWLGRIAVIGGYLPDRTSSTTVDVLDLSSCAWLSAPPLPEGRNHTQAAVLGDRLYVVGGFAASGTLASVVSLGADETRWRAEPSLREPRGAHGLAVVGERLVVFGGVDRGRLVRTAEVFDGRAWTVVPGLPTPREHLGGAGAGGRAYAVGGRVGGLSGNLAVVESWAPGESAWRREPDLNHTRGGTSAAAVGDVVCVAGGEEPGRTIPSVECLRGGRWQVVASLDEPRHGLAVVGLGRELHVLGGGPKPGLFVSTAHEIVQPPN